MPTQSAYHVADWNGPNGERWVAHRARLDAMLAAFGEAAITAAALAPGEQVLDIGCGAGTTSFMLAGCVGSLGHVLGVDISAPLIAAAQALAPGNAPVAFRLGDAAAVSLQRGGFDLFFSRFGVMFFDDSLTAFRNLRLALKHTGRIAFVCWRSAEENDWVRLPMGAIKDIVPGTPSDPEAPGPFSFGSRDRVWRLLIDAGFTDIAIEGFDHTIPFGAGETRDAALDDALDMAFEVGPLSRALAGQSEDIRARAAQAVRAVFATRPGEQSVMIEGAAWIVTARNFNQ